MNERVLIVEPLPLLADAQRMLVEDAGLTVTGTAGAEDEAVAMALHHRPDVVLSNPRLAQGNGVAAAWRYRSEIGCVVLFLPTFPKQLQAAGPPACLSTTVSLVSGPLIQAALWAAVHWRRLGRPPDILPDGVMLIGASSPPANLVPSHTSSSRLRK